MQLGFVIDHARCIGCHACTVACKSENDVPLGSFRTWVKYTESGSFPEVRRSFAVLRCNQCSQAPCVEICPVRALEKRSDGIVDVDPQRCIGCKACMQGCPYDALYINDRSGTAEKCHFCAHRSEIGLAPACAVVCPTEAIIPGDFHDPQSRVARLKAQETLVARKTEAGTRPNVLYREVAPEAIDPLQTHGAGGYLWSQRLPGPQLDAELFVALEGRAKARTTYDVAHPPVWGTRVSAYLVTKSIAAGSMLAAAPLLPPLSAGGGLSARSGLLVCLLSLTAWLVTNVLLVADLKRPERFLYILLYPNRDSWLARGAWVLAGFGAVVALWAVRYGLDLDPGPLLGSLLLAATPVAAALAAVYTAWLFRQAKGRVLWMRRDMVLVLLLHAIGAGAATLLLLSSLFELADPAIALLRRTLIVVLALQLLLVLGEGRMAPRPREEEYSRALRLLTHGPYARRRWLIAVGAGLLLPLALLWIDMPLTTLAAAALTLVGLLIEQDTLVRAGQAASIS